MNMNEHLGIEIAVPGHDKIVQKPKVNPQEKRVSLHLPFSQIDSEVMNHFSFIKTIRMYIRMKMKTCLHSINNIKTPFINSNISLLLLNMVTETDNQNLTNRSLRTLWFGILQKTLLFQCRERKWLHLLDKAIISQNQEPSNTLKSKEEVVEHDHQEEIKNKDKIQLVVQTETMINLG